MTARQGKDRRRLTRRKIAWAAGLVLAFSLVGAIGFARHRQALARWRREREREETARQQASDAASLALKMKISDLRNAWSQAHIPSQPHYELLLALARATPPGISLRELRCDGDGFVLRGQVHEKADRPDSPLVQFCRDLAAPEAPWRFPNGPEVAAGAFSWHGVFQETALSPQPDGGPKADPIPAAVGQWEEKVSVARAALPAEKEFKAEAERWNSRWTVLAQSADLYPDLAVRHWALAHPHPTLGAWSDIVQTVRGLCAERGVSVDSLVLAAAPDGSDAFTQAQITLTARFRR